MAKKLSVISNLGPQFGQKSIYKCALFPLTNTHFCEWVKLAILEVLLHVLLEVAGVVEESCNVNEEY